MLMCATSYQSINLAQNTNINEIFAKSLPLDARVKKCCLVALMSLSLASALATYMLQQQEGHLD